MKRGILVFMAMVLCIGLSDLKLSSQDRKAKPKKAKIIYMKLKNHIPERAVDAFGFFQFTQPLTVWKISEALDQAATDDQIKGVMIHLNPVELGIGQLNELIASFQRFRSSGKKIYCYMETFGGLGEVILASACDEVTIPLSQFIVIPGLRAKVLLLKGLLDKLGIEVQVLKKGEYKGGEMFTEDKDISQYLKEELNSLLDSWYENITATIAKSRGVKQEAVKSWIDQAIFSPEKAKEMRLVDKIEEFAKWEQRVKGELDKDAEFTYLPETAHRMEFANIFDFFNLFMPKKKKEDEKKIKIAILYAEGTILDGEAERGLFSQQRGIFSHDFTATIREIKNDDSIKAVILRINSPGGSATASELIRQELKLLDEKKPVIVSMGNIAASGGYYIAGGGRKIVAESMTITGSIGVIGLVFNLEKLMDKLALKTVTIKRGKFADIASMDRKITEEEAKLLDGFLEWYYDFFKKRVSESRNMNLKAVEEVAKGRVWTGEQAKNKGLVDELGGLNKAIEIARKEAQLEDVEVTFVQYPKAPTWVELLTGGYSYQPLDFLLESQILENWIPHMKLFAGIVQGKAKSNVFYLLPVHISTEF